MAQIEKIMSIYYGKNRLPYKDEDRHINYPVLGSELFVGENNVTTIRFYVDEIGGNQFTWVAVVKLPDGSSAYKPLEEASEEGYVELDISNIYTTQVGAVFISLRGYTSEDVLITEEDGVWYVHGNPTVLTTGVVKIMVNYAPQVLGMGGDLTYNQYQLILALLSTKIGYPTEVVRVNELPEQGLDNYIYVVQENDTLHNVYIWNGKTHEYVFIGSNKIDLGAYYTKEEGEEFEEEILDRVGTVESQVQGLASGAPNGSYATLSDLETAHPTGDNHIYLVLADGKWYYWNTSTTQWTAGGTYLSSLPDSELNDTSTNSIRNSSVTIGIEEVSKKVLNHVASNNLFDKEKNVLTDGYYILYDGTLASGYYFTTDYIFLKAGTYVFQPSWKMPAKERIIVAFYSLDKVFDSNIGAYSNTADINSKQFTMLRDGYVRFSFEKHIIKYSVYGLKYYAPLIVEGSDLKFADDYYCVSKKQPQILKNSINIINPEEIENGYVYSDGVINEDDTTYKSTGYIKLEKNKTYSIKGVCRFIWLKEVASETTTYLQNQTDYQFTPTVDMYMRVSATKANFGKLVVEESSTMPTKFVFPQYDLENVIVQTSPLTKKCYVACGDSFTKGGYDGTEGLEPSVYTFQDGLYIGQQKTYPLFIGIRNNMYVINEAVGGSTMARWEGDSDTSSFSRVRYQNIPSDADYITLKFGINDENKNIPIGNIDSNDVYTFYGAWNTVMSYIIEHHPKAKIGIIISNGIYNQDYVNATRNIAEKYGIPYLDEQQDKKVPLLNRVYRTGVSTTIRDLRNTTFRISATNTHPNVDAQEYESTFVENFLKTL